MAPIKTVFVPRLGSQLGSSQRREDEGNRTEPSTQSQSEKRGNKRCKNWPATITRSVLKVKLPKFNNTLQVKVTKDGTTPTKCMPKPATSEPSTSGEQGRKTQCANTVSALVDGDVFFFSQRSETTNPKEKAQLSALRTISKMLAENQLIRQRLAALSQAN